jgi:hypothetical protein
MFGCPTHQNLGTSAPYPGSDDNTVRLWDGEFIQEITTEYGPRKLVFNMDESSLETDREKFQLSLLTAHHIQPLFSPSSSYSLDKTHHWVTWDSRNILFLPHDRRSGDFAVKDNVLAMGHASGRLTFLEFQPHLNPLGNVGYQ